MKLGGVPEGKGDVAYRIPMFPFLDVMLQYWDSDDEFPASLQLFVDDGMTDFIHMQEIAGSSWYVPLAKRSGFNILGRFALPENQNLAFLYEVVAASKTF